MQDFEKLGAFYLGKRYDDDAQSLTDELVLYDSKDLNTHAVIIGMTGSGKTGLGIGMIEEAAMDHIPVIAIDPKGDLGNLLLSFPDLAPADFRPWINASEAANKGMTPDEFAKAQASLWRKGLGEWGQDGARIEALRARTDMAVYTPGSTAGLPVSVLRSFDPPGEAVRDDGDLYRERIQSTATGILALLGINADPVTSREHILIANLLDHAWSKGRGLDIASLIGLIQNPPLERIGVMALEDIYPAKDRFALAMQLNNLLAAPGFEAWMEGEPLSAQGLLYTAAGKPRVSVMSIAHLAESERMFFVCMLLNELIAWMRAQPGTASLRAMLYMDEIFGYMPPVANPPSKQLLLTLLKQARAYGLGLVLSTQNPVDLDYKGLSNTGTWMIGRLQTERDKARVMEGLEGASAGGGFDRPAMERTLAGLGKRRFLLHNVHEDAPVVFNTRWVMSYLAGPLTRDQIRTLMADRNAAREAEKDSAAGAQTLSATASEAATRNLSETPIVDKRIREYWLDAAGEPGDLVYRPALLGAAELVYSSARYKVEEDRQCLAIVMPTEGPVPIDWDNADVLDVELADLAEHGADGAAYAALPDIMADAGEYGTWEKNFKRWLRKSQFITLYRSDAMKETSRATESEGDFRARLQTLASERRDIEVGKLRKRYASKINTLENRLMRAQQAVERESEQAKKKKIDTFVSFGTAILGAVLGRKRLSTTSAGRIGTAVKSAGGIGKEAADVERAEATVQRVRDELAELQQAFDREVEALDSAYDSQHDSLTEIPVKPKSTDIQIHFVGLLWMPYVRDSKGRLTAVTP